MSNNLIPFYGNGQYNDLIERVQSDDTKAFEELYDIFYQRVIAFALNFLKCNELAEEIVHDAFMKIWEIRMDLNPQLSLDGLIFKITKNLMLNSLRLKVNQPVYFESLKDTDIVSNETENQMYEQEVELQLSYA
ncbi:MAG: RNA polymerase sigma factor (sigma-70 family), partial [Cyclobacteriaceae bacterium]